MPTQNLPVAFCPVHGLFDQPMMRGASVPCPDCGRDSRVLDGRDKHVMLRGHGIVGTGASMEAVFDMRDLLERVQRGEIGPDPAIVKAQKLDAQFGRVMSQALRIEAWSVPVLISLLSLYFRLKDDHSGRAPISNLVKVIDRQREPLEQLRAALGAASVARPSSPPAATA